MLSSAAKVYITMLAIFIAGLWAILSLGAIFLRAPIDLSGDWQLRPAASGEGDAPLHSLWLEQSGRYSHVMLDKTAGFELKRTDEVREEQSVGRDRLKVTLAGARLRLTFTGVAPMPGQSQDEYTLVASGGGLDGTWKVVRTNSPVRPANRHE